MNYSLTSNYTHYTVNPQGEMNAVLIPRTSNKMSDLDSLHLLGHIRDVMTFESGLTLISNYSGEVALIKEGKFKKKLKFDKMAKMIGFTLNNFEFVLIFLYNGRFKLWNLHTNDFVDEYPPGNVNMDFISIFENKLCFKTSKDYWIQCIYVDNNGDFAFADPCKIADHQRGDIGIFRDRMIARADNHKKIVVENASLFGDEEYHLVNPPDIGLPTKLYCLDNRRAVVVYHRNVIILWDVQGEFIIKRWDNCDTFHVDPANKHLYINFHGVYHL